MSYQSWQDFLDKTVEESRCDGSLQIFSQLKNDTDRIEFCVKQKSAQIIDWIDPYLMMMSQYKPVMKDADKSVELRQKGNKFFQKKCNESALHMYNESIQQAPYHGPGKSQVYAVAVANRSAVLLHMKEYQMCLRDIDDALQSGFPADLVYKLKQRQAQCFCQLQMYAEASEAFEEALESLESQQSIDAKKKESLVSEIKSQIAEISLSDPNNSKHKLKVNDGRKNGHSDRKKEAEIRVTHQANPVVVQASSAVELQCNTEQGRFLVANQQIEAGDVLIVEKPFAAVLLPTHDHSHCHHCYSTFMAPTVCRQCSCVLYCSAGCRDAAWTQYHWLECSNLSLLRSIGVAHLSLRIVMVAGLQYLIDYMKKTASCTDSGSQKTCVGISDDGSYTCNYDSVYHLMTHSDKMHPEDLYQYTLTAVLLLKCLTRGGFFDKKCGSCDTKTQPSSSRAQNLDFEKLCIEVRTVTPCESCSVCSVQKRDSHCVQGNCDDHSDCHKKCDKMSSVCDTSNSVCNSLQSKEDIVGNTEIQKSTVDLESRSGHRHCMNSGTSNEKLCGDVFSDEELLIGGLLLRHIQQLICNAHAITELQATRLTDDVDAQSQVRIATAIYPTTSLMNHSCDPTIISSFHNDTLIVRAVKSVPSGGQIYNCYGPHWKRMRWQERQQVLQSQYFFHCVCHACQQGEQADKPFQAFRCAYCEGWVDENQCVECKGNSDTASARQQLDVSRIHFVKGLTLVEKAEIKAGLAEMLKCLQIRNKILYKHNRELSEVEDHTARCFAMLGKYKIAATYLSKSVATTEMIYGSESIELANELHKYAQVLFNAKQITVVTDVIDRAVKLFRLHYGSECTQICELQEMKQCVQQYVQHL